MYDGKNLAQVSDTLKVSDTYGVPCVYTPKWQPAFSSYIFKNNQKFPSCPLYFP